MYPFYGTQAREILSVLILYFFLALVKNDATWLFNSEWQWEVAVILFICWVIVSIFYTLLGILLGEWLTGLVAMCIICFLIIDPWQLGY